MLIKHPALRVADIADVDSAFLDTFYADLKQWVSLLPFSALVTDLEIVGSYARGAARLPSDIDINVATDTEDARIEAHDLMAANKAQYGNAYAFLRTLWKKYGLMIQPQLQHPTVKTVSYKRCFSLRDRKYYGTEKRRMWKRLEDGSVHERIRIELRTPRFNISHQNEEGDQVEFIPDEHDPFLSEVPKYRKLYKRKFQEFGDTDETRHIRKTRKV